jgi:branched-chain amino acid transport system permease protein
VVSAVFAGLSGALYASVVGFISPTLFTLQNSVTYVAMAVIGGAGSLAGPALSATLLTLLQYTDAIIPGLSREAGEIVQEYQADVYALAIILVVLFAPAGLGALFKGRGRGGEGA